RVLWRINVPSSDRCVQDCTRGAGGTFARPQVCASGHAMAHAAFATVWRDPNFAGALSAPLAESNRFAAKVRVKPFPFYYRHRLSPVRFARAALPSRALCIDRFNVDRVTCPTRDGPAGPWLQIDSAGI